jgi:hypothetical protein
VVGFVFVGKTHLLVPEKGVRTMSAEDRNGQVSTDEECTDCTTRERSFDALARGLANGSISRRKALRMLGAALVGSALASIPGVALAKPPPGTCKELGFKCAANTECCSKNCIKNPQGNGKICGCPTNQTLCGNRCITCNNTGEIVNPATCQCECPTGKSLVNGTCVATCIFEGQCVGPNCGVGCFCRETTEGVPICVSNFAVGQFDECTSTAQCGLGSVCVQPCTGPAQCVPFPGQLCSV